MDTLCSQAHGANQSTKMGTYSLTGFAILFFVFLLASSVVWNATSVLLALGQPAQVSVMAGTFARCLLPGLPFVYAYELIRKVSQARNEAMPMLISSIVCNVVNLGLGYYLVHFTKWGWMGAALARAVGNAVMVPVILTSMIMGLGGNRSICVKRKENVVNSEKITFLNGVMSDLGPGCGKEEEGGDGEEKDDVDFLWRIWEGFVISEALNLNAIIEFLDLGIPGMLQVMFEW